MNRLLFKIIRYSGLPVFFREILQKDKVSIFLFHDISKEAAERTFSYLSKKYNIIGLEQFLYACQHQKSTDLPKKAAILTFDDGHIRNYELLPIIKKYNLPVTIYLCAGIVNTNRHFWFKYENLNGSSDSLKKMPNQERLNALIAKGFEQEKEFEKPQALSKQQILEMRDYINFQAHTMFHPCLPTCTTAEASEEMTQSKNKLEADYGLKINAIAYPNGDYTDREIQLAKDAGYMCGVTVEPGFNTINSDLFKLKRLSLNDTDNLDELIVKASGVWGFLKGKKKKLIN